MSCKLGMRIKSSFGSGTRIILESGDWTRAMETLEESHFILLDSDPRHSTEPVRPVNRYSPACVNGGAKAGHCLLPLFRASALVRHATRVRTSRLPALPLCGIPQRDETVRRKCRPVQVENRDTRRPASGV